MSRAEHDSQKKAPLAADPAEPQVMDVTRMTDASDSGDETMGRPNPLDDVPFERGFPPAGGAELTNSYIPGLERAIEEARRSSQQT
jgi:hypothetical protein